MKKMLAMTIVFSATCSAGFAQDWYTVASSGTYKFEAKIGTFQVGKNDSGKQVALVTGRTVNSEDHSIQLEKWYVPTANCRQGEGKIIATDLDGAFLYDNNFVFDSGNIASAKAMFICSIYEYQRGQGLKKGS